MLISTAVDGGNLILSSLCKNFNFFLGNWSKEKTEERVEKLLRRPTIQKLFDGYYFDYNKERHRYQHLEENSEQSWYLDSKGNIKETGKENEENKDDSKFFCQNFE